VSSYCDTSYLVALYVPNVHTTAALRHREQTGSDQADAVAERLAWTYSCRSLDLWHVAVAVEIGVEDFVTFDKDQFDLAKAAGLRAIIPR